MPPTQPPPRPRRFTVDPPIEPMLAKPIAGLPDSAEGLAFQPKWDGFRVLVYRRGDDVVIQGRMRAADAAAESLFSVTDNTNSRFTAISRKRRLGSADSLALARALHFV